MKYIQSFGKEFSWKFASWEAEREMVDGMTVSWVLGKLVWMQMTVAEESCLWGAFWGTSEESNLAYVFIFAFYGYLYMLECKMLVYDKDCSVMLQYTT